MNASRRHAPRSFMALDILVVALAASSLALSWKAYPPYLSVQLVLAIAAAAFSALFSVELPAYSVSMSYVMAMCAIVLGGPAAAGLVAASSAVTIDDIRGHKPISHMLFNVGNLVLSSCAGGLVYVALGGQVLATGAGSFSLLAPSSIPRALVAMTVASFVVAFTNAALVSAAMALLRGQRFHQIFAAGRSVMVTQFALGYFGLLMAQTLAINVVTLPLFVFPLVVARQFYQRSVRLSEAYADTVRSLVGALEAKDPYTRGHSERVAAYALALGRQVGLDEAALERLEYAALLHDLGKLAVPGEILTKPGRLSAEEWESIREHPARGAEMVARIPPLKDLAEQVGKHHEWYGGGGYPDSLSSAEIPLAAKVLAVADCYDAMTTTRAYRPALTREQAIGELIAGANTQFDPDLVRAFIEGQVGLGACVEGSPSPVESGSSARAFTQEG